MTLEEAIEMLAEVGDKYGMDLEIRAAHVSESVVVLRLDEMSSLVSK